MTEVRHNTFVKQLLKPSIDLTLDSSQYIGEAVKFDPAQCPHPYASDTGSQYCAQICSNTCPELNPDAVAGMREQLTQYLSDLGFAEEAQSEALADLASATTLITISGSASFAIPAGASTSVIGTVRGMVESQLAANVAYDMDVTVSAVCHFACEHEM
jgi:hypothetical protein